MSEDEVKVGVKEIIIYNESPFSETSYITTMQCVDYRIYRYPPDASYDTLEVTRLNGNKDTFIMMTKVCEVVWRKPR